MASRAIIRRKRVISDYLNASARSIQSLQSLGHVQSAKSLDVQSSNPVPFHSSGHLINAKDVDAVRIAREDLPIFPGIGIFSHRCNRILKSGIGNGRFEFTLPMSIRLGCQSIRTASTAMAGQPDLGSDDEDKEGLVAKKRKEASPEDCDEAVEGLSTAKAKATAKQLQESKKGAKFVLQKVWATLLGIGPALRAVASMSRLDICQFFLFI